MNAETALWAVIPAAGRGQRFGGEIPKQYQMLGDKTVLDHSVERILQPSAVQGAVIVRSDPDHWWDKHAWNRIKPVHWVVTQGAERMDSVRDGVLFAAEKLGATHVLVHDAARPLIQKNNLQQLIDLALPDPAGGLLAVPVRDALKKSVSHRVTGHIERASLWHAQTPQLFAVSVLLQALQVAKTARQIVADESEAVAALGLQPRLVNGSWLNIKMTYAEDLALATQILMMEQHLDGTS